MDGQTLETDPRTAEYMRQREVFERSMADLKLQARKREAAGYAVMAAAYSFEPATFEKGGFARAAKAAKILLIAAAGIIPNIAMFNLLAG